MVKKDYCSKPKATKRHAAIASKWRREEEQMKDRIYVNKERNKETIKTRREEIGKLPKEERAPAKEILRKDIEEIKAKELTEKEEYYALVKKRKEKEKAMKKSRKS